MNIDIRRYVIDNFKDDSNDDILKSITESISSHDDDVLVGLGVFFELAWSNSNEKEKYNILNNIKKGITNY